MRWRPAGAARAAAAAQVPPVQAAAYECIARVGTMGYTTDDDAPSLSYRLRSKVVHALTKALRFLEGSSRSRYGWCVRLRRFAEPQRGGRGCWAAAAGAAAAAVPGCARAASPRLPCRLPCAGTRTWRGCTGL